MAPRLGRTRNEHAARNTTTTREAAGGTQGSTAVAGPRCQCKERRGVLPFWGMRTSAFCLQTRALPPVTCPLCTEYFQILTALPPPTCLWGPPGSCGPRCTGGRQRMGGARLSCLPRLVRSQGQTVSIKTFFFRKLWTGTVLLSSVSSVATC